MTSELKDCPFCHGDHYIVCFRCKAKGPVEDTETEAPQAWNTRRPISAEEVRKAATRHFEASHGEAWIDLGPTAQACQFSYMRQALRALGLEVEDE